MTPGRWLTIAALAPVVALAMTGCSSSTLPAPAESAREVKVLIPDLIGSSGSSAEQALSDLDLRADFDGVPSDDGGPSEWLVVEQEPQPGTELRPGALVTLTVESATPTPAAWNGPEDGTWNWGDVALGDPIRGNETTMGPLTSDYEITVVAPPSFTSSDNGESVTMTSPLKITRVQDRGFEQTISESERIFFETTERPASEALNETWGVYTRLACETENLTTGETTECTVSFTTEPGALVNSHWRISGKLAAAWPGQQP